MKKKFSSAFSPDDKLNEPKVNFKRYIISYSSFTHKLERKKWVYPKKVRKKKFLFDTRRNVDRASSRVSLSPNIYREMFRCFYFYHRVIIFGRFGGFFCCCLPPVRRRERRLIGVTSSFAGRSFFFFAGSVLSSREPGRSSAVADVKWLHPQELSLFAAAPPTEGARGWGGGGGRRGGGGGGSRRGGGGGIGRGGGGRGRETGGRHGWWER